MVEHSTQNTKVKGSNPAYLVSHEGTEGPSDFVVVHVGRKHRSEENENEPDRNRNLHLASALSNFIRSSMTMDRNKLECLYLVITFKPSLTFAGNTRSFPRRKHLKDPPVGFALALPSNSKSSL